LVGWIRIVLPLFLGGGRWRGERKRGREWAVEAVASIKGKESLSGVYGYAGVLKALLSY